MPDTLELHVSRARDAFGDRSVPDGATDEIELADHHQRRTGDPWQEWNDVIKLPGVPALTHVNVPSELTTEALDVSDRRAGIRRGVEPEVAQSSVWKERSRAATSMHVRSADRLELRFAVVTTRTARPSNNAENRNANAGTSSHSK